MLDVVEEVADDVNEDVIETAIVAVVEPVLEGVSVGSRILIICGLLYTILSPNYIIYNYYLSLFAELYY